MKTRAIFGGIFIAIVLTCLFVGSWAVVLLFSLCAFLGLREFYGQTEKMEKAELGVLLPIGIAVGTYLVFSVGVYYILDWSVNWVAVLPVLFTIPLGVGVFLRLKNGVQSFAYLYLGLIYVALLFSMIFFWLKDAGIYESKYLFGGLLFIWANDVFAYLSGRAFGKTKLIEHVSPNKTWEGTIGGFIVAMIFGFVYSFFLDLPIISWMGFAFLCAVCASVGDLVESVIKRSLGVKDMGTLIPGHGGILDRFDALLFAAPFGAVYIYLFL